ncbi:hypothetical protein [Microbacterium pumilum]|uniref:hypothetical protein n=1 Tax=Microbacterium pumilum TaxID=344165 RepID=UPI0031D781A2
MSAKPSAAMLSWEVCGASHRSAVQIVVLDEQISAVLTSSGTRQRMPLSGRDDIEPHIAKGRNRLPQSSGSNVGSGIVI